jgi:hypothetical protein
MAKRQAPKSAFRSRPKADAQDVQPAPCKPKNVTRPSLPDFPLFCQPGRVSHAYGRIIGPDAFGGGCIVADIRGWGYLTGHGMALALSNDDAARAQMRAGDFIAAAINEKLERDGHIPAAEDGE